MIVDQSSLSEIVYLWNEYKDKRTYDLLNEIFYDFFYPKIIKILRKKQVNSVITEISDFHFLIYEWYWEAVHKFDYRKKENFLKWLIVFNINRFRNYQRKEVLGKKKISFEDEMEERKIEKFYFYDFCEQEKNIVEKNKKENIFIQMIKLVENYSNKSKNTELIKKIFEYKLNGKKITDLSCELNIPVKKIYYEWKKLFSVLKKSIKNMKAI